MNLRRALKVALATTAFSTSLIALAGPASAAPPPWLVAGDQNGALGNCDPAFLAKTPDEGLTWTSQAAFQPTGSPCAFGGRINEVAAAPNGRWFAAGYRFTATGTKQGILFYSEDASTWSVARVIPAGPTDTEYLDVAADGQLVTLVATSRTQHATHPIGGSMATGWTTTGVLGSSSLVYRDADILRPWSNLNLGSGAWYAGSVIGASGRRCGAFAESSGPTIVDNPAANVCIPGYDVSFEAIDTMHGNFHIFAVGSATSSGQPTRPVVMSIPNSLTSGTSQLLPGEGSLRSVERGGGDVLVAVGAKRVLGTNLASIFRSTDLGLTWTSIPVPATAKPLNKVIYQKSGWVAVGDNGTLLRSVDGLSWTLANPPAAGAASLRSITTQP